MGSRTLRRVEGSIKVYDLSVKINLVGKEKEKNALLSDSETPRNDSGSFTNPRGFHNPQPPRPHPPTRPTVQPIPVSNIHLTDTRLRQWVLVCSGPLLSSTNNSQMGYPRKRVEG